TGLKPTKVWQLIRDGRLEVVRVDGRTLVKYPSVERLLSPEQDEQPAPRKTPRRKRNQAPLKAGAEAPVPEAVGRSGPAADKSTGKPRRHRSEAIAGA